MYNMNEMTPAMTPTPPVAQSWFLEQECELSASRFPLIFRYFFFENGKAQHNTTRVAEELGLQHESISEGPEQRLCIGLTTFPANTMCEKNKP